MSPEPTGPEGPPDVLPDPLGPPPGHPGLRAAVLELEQHAAASGWDQPAQLYALVPAGVVIGQDPAAAELAGLPRDADPDALVSIEQGDLPEDLTLEELLGGIEWPPEVEGAAVVVERLVLPPSVGEVPQDPGEAARFAGDHPEREEVRIAAGALRDGATYAALRLRSRDDEWSRLESPDLVPGLLELLVGTLRPMDDERSR